MSTTEYPAMLDDLLIEHEPAQKLPDGTKVPAVPELRITTRELDPETAAMFQDDQDRNCPFRTVSTGGPKSPPHEWRWATEAEARAGHAATVELIREIEELPSEVGS